MQESKWQALYRQEARVLGELGAILARVDLPDVEVRLPDSLARRAVTAWEREHDEGSGEPETYEQRAQRHRAATLSLIGLSITERGRWEGDEVVVALSPDLIGVAVDAADDLPAT
jgi:hypothetical protein